MSVCRDSDVPVGVGASPLYTTSSPRFWRRVPGDQGGSPFWPPNDFINSLAIRFLNAPLFVSGPLVSLPLRITAVNTLCTQY